MLLHAAATYDAQTSVNSLWLLVAAALVAASAAIGWFGAYVVTTRHLVAGRPR